VIPGLCSNPFFGSSTKCPNVMDVPFYFYPFCPKDVLGNSFAMGALMERKWSMTGVMLEGMCDLDCYGFVGFG
jgi:hypothetical protein